MRGASFRFPCDLDLAIVGVSPLDCGTLSQLKEAFEQSDLPMRVDVLDWHTITDSIRKVIEQDYVVVQKGTDEKNWHLGNNWCECVLADTCHAIDYGLTAPAAENETGPKFLRLTDIVSGNINWKTVPHVVADATTRKYQLHDGDIVLARTGASTGESAYVKAPPLAVFASYLVRLQLKPEFDGRFLAYYLRSGNFGHSFAVSLEISQLNRMPAHQR